MSLVPFGSEIGAKVGKIIFGINRQLHLSIHKQVCKGESMGLSIWHILIVLVVVIVVFGAGRLPQVMGDLGNGIRSFKAGMSADDKLV
jgi:TatA/E family protein of Tat protein translocase